MTTKETGGPAFPDWTKDGMTLRDYFAAKAMTGALGTVNEFHHADIFARWCYEMADAMLKARHSDTMSESSEVNHG